MRLQLAPYKSPQMGEVIHSIDTSATPVSMVVTANSDEVPTRKADLRHTA